MDTFNLEKRKNGVIGFEATYEIENGVNWFDAIPDNDNSEVFNFIENGINSLDFSNELSTLGNGWFSPYFLSEFRERINRFGGYITPIWTLQGGLVRSLQSLEKLNNVDIVFTDDKSKWSRCVIIESSSPSLTQFGLQTEQSRAHFDLRGAPSVGKEDSNNEGLPDPDGDGEGMGWFPGYAIDIETGQRLNIFFGESSIYRCNEPFFSDILDACNVDIFKNNSPTLSLIHI